MPQPTELELETLVKARYPLIYLLSWEERRAEQMLERLAKRRGKGIFFWTVTQGLCDPAKSCDPSARDPQAALDFVAKSDQQALFVLKDFHSFMQDAGVIRRLRDLVQNLRTNHKNLILLSPVLTIPPELEKDVTVVDYELPGPEELGQLFDQMVAASKNNTRFTVDMKPGDKERILQAALGMTLAEAENALARAVVQDAKLSAEDVGVILEEKKQIIRKSRLLEYFEASEQLTNVGGLELLKDWLAKRGRAFSEKARQFGLPQPKGVLLLGVQGCGEILPVARALRPE